MKSDTLFMNISSDHVVIFNGENEIFLERNDVEKTLWPKLIQLIREWNYNRIIVLNWPWWFTNLRVGTLCINILNSVMNNQIDFFDISKIDLYQKACEKWLLPNLWIIYIGQKRNIWLWNFEKNEKVWQFSFDGVKEKLNTQYFIDEVIDENYYPEWVDKTYETKTEFNGETLVIKYWDKSISFSVEDLGLQPIKSVAPNYMIEPNITLTTKK